jgi:hypothetical protein
MISENNESEIWRERAVMTWAFIAALPLSLLWWLLLGWALFANIAALAKLMGAPQAKPELVTTSTVVRIERKTVPIPQQPQARPQPLQRPQQQQAEKAEQHAQPIPEARPTEIARMMPNAPAQPTPAKTVQKKASLSEILAQQQAAFAKEAAQISAANHAPISVATVDPNSAPAARQPFQMDISGIPGMPRHGEGIITPVRSWRDGGLDCYYARYWYEYPNGEREAGVIPWPFCFAPRLDPFLRGVHTMPMPFPMPGFALPSGTQLLPQEKETYDAWLSEGRP